MTDPRDPYADRPYVPPTPPQPASPSGGWPFAEPRAGAVPTSDHEPTVAVNEPTVVQQPAYEAPAATEPTLAFGGDSGGTVPPTWDTTPAPAAAPRRKRRAGRLVAAATGIILLAGASAAGGAAIYAALDDDSSVGTTSTGTALDRPASATKSTTSNDISAVAEAVLPATVQINVAGRGESGTGTGIVISEDGDILTNNHVVEAAAEGGTITVAFNDGTNATARIVGRDVATDVAVIKAQDVSGLTAATLGDSKQVRVGQTVVAIGSPFGLESTVTQGIVSALNRPVSPGDGSGYQQGGTTTTFPAIQTDAAINPGNSGGPLVNMDGQVIGINSAINTGGNGNGSVGLGFAIPINLVNNVATQILNGKTVEHARIGVEVSSATGEDKITSIGAEISEVTMGGAGEKAGLKSGDIVTKVDGNPISSNSALVATIRGYQPGDEVTLTVLRDGKSQEIKVELDSDNGATARRQE